MFVVVYGAGAVGSVLGGLLSVHNHDVLLVGRSKLVNAINDEGLRLRSVTGDYVAHPRVTHALSSSDIPSECSRTSRIRRPSGRSSIGWDSAPFSRPYSFQESWDTGSLILSSSLGSWEGWAYRLKRSCLLGTISRPMCRVPGMRGSSPS